MIRKAEQKDLKGILSIYDKTKLDRNKLGDSRYVASIQKKGFLLGLDNPETFISEIERAYAFFVAEENNRIVGYLFADHSEEQKFYDDEFKTWFDLGIKDFYYHNLKGMTIAAITVDPDWTNKGVASEMLATLERQLINDSYEKLFSIVTVAPLTNCPSIVWHTKHGFIRLAMGKPRERLFDLEWYSGVLLYKDLRV